MAKRMQDKESIAGVSWLIVLALSCWGDYAGAADEFLRWNKAGGKVLNGLTRRREAERALFLS